MAEEIKILHIEALLSAIDDMQIACEPTVDTDLGFRMWGGVDAYGNITRWLAKGEDAIINELVLNGPTTTGDAGVLVFDTDGNITGETGLYDMLSIDDGEIVYGNATSDGVTSDPDFTWNDSDQSLSMGTNSSATGTNALAHGNTADATGNYSEARGISVSASGGASRVLGASSTAGHDYSDVRGNGVISVWPGASHFGGDQLDGNNSSQCMGEMPLVVQTTDASATDMLFDLGDSDSPLYCPDGCAQFYDFLVMAASVSGTENGIALFSGKVLVMRADPDFNAIAVGSLAVHNERGTANWQTEMGNSSVTISSDGTEHVAILQVHGIASTTINWVANISRGVQSETNYYDGGSA